MTVDGDHWVYVVGTDPSTVSGGDYSARQARTEVPGRVLERDLLARWRALASSPVSR